MSWINDIIKFNFNPADFADLTNPTYQSFPFTTQDLSFSNSVLYFKLKVNRYQTLQNYNIKNYNVYFAHLIFFLKRFN